MIVLGVDTCGAEGSLALAYSAGALPAGPPQLLEEVALQGRRYAGLLVPELRALLGRHSVAVSALGAIAVVRGPGSFTGIRMGLSLVKGLSEAAGIAVVALSRLEVLARTHESATALLDAGRGEFYLRDSAGECLLAQDEVLARVGTESLAVACEASAAALPGIRLVPAPRAMDAVLLAQERLLLRDFEDPATLDGHYVRRPEYRAAGTL